MDRYISSSSHRLVWWSRSGEDRKRARWAWSIGRLALGLVAGQLVVPFPGAAQELPQSAPQKKLTYEQTQSLIYGNTLTFQGLGQSTFHQNGTYSFTEEGQNYTRYGIFNLRADGKVCLDQPDKKDRCDIFVEERGLLFLLTPEGQRFSVTFKLKVD
jgi:hypothetical protein